MNIRRLALDVDKARERPDLITLAAAIEAVEGVEGVNITVTGIDMSRSIPGFATNWCTPRNISPSDHVGRW